MKLFLSLTLSLLLALLPAFSAADMCCYAGQNMQKQMNQQETTSQDKAASMKNCHKAMLQVDQHSHSQCQCEHHTASSLPSTPASKISLLVTVTRISNAINTPHLSYVLDSLYTPTDTCLKNIKYNDISNKYISYRSTASALLKISIAYCV